MPELRRICVFCGSSSGARPAYREAAAALADALVDAGLGLVYGGASVGLMGAVADGVLARGGEVIGVLPQALVEREIAHPGLTELHVVESMGARKALMAELADGFVALPGGLGTLEELFEMVVRSQLGLHDKPVALLDVEGFWTGLRAFLDHTAAEALVRPENVALLLHDDDPVRLLATMATHRAPMVEKWID